VDELKERQRALGEAREPAGAAALEIEWIEGDAEELPFATPASAV
jgi:ubiquinone/menaquinone biosynthesis C-methylase UbiE